MTNRRAAFCPIADTCPAVGLNARFRVFVSWRMVPAPTRCPTRCHRVCLSVCQISLDFSRENDSLWKPRSPSACASAQSLSGVRNHRNGRTQLVVSLPQLLPPPVLYPLFGQGFGSGLRDSCAGGGVEIGTQKQHIP